VSFFADLANVYEKDVVPVLGENDITPGRMTWPLSRTRTWTGPPV
jgi:hypothetical protein